MSIHVCRFWALLILVASGLATAGEVPELVARWPYATTKAVAVSGNLAVFGSGTSIIGADITDMNAPVELGWVALDGAVNDIAMIGELAVVAADDAGLQIVDFSVPTVPAKVASIGFGPASHVAVGGDCAYVATTSSGSLRIVDISIPTEPALIGTLTVSTSEIRDITVEGSMLFLAVGDRLMIVDADTPSNPTVIGELAITAFAVATYLNHAIVVGFEEVVVVNVDQPSAPNPVGSLPLPSYGYWIANHGPTIAVGVDARVLLASVDDPAMPVETGTVDTSGLPKAAVVRDDHLVLADLSSLRLFDVGDPAQPVETARVATATRSGFVDIGDSIVAALSEFQLDILEISDPASLHRIGLYEWGWEYGMSGGFELVGDRVYLARGGRFEIIDIADPAYPTVQSSLDLEDVAPCTASMIGHVQDMVYVRCWDWNVIDVSNPSEPVVVNELGWSGGAMAVAGDVAYLADGLLRVIDVSNPAAPARMGSSLGYAVAVAVEGQRLFVTTLGNPQAGVDGGLHVFDLSDPLVPAEIGSWPTGQNAWAVEAAGDIAYIAEDDGGIVVVDTSDPLGFRLLGSFEMPGGTFDVAVGGGFVVAAHSDSGVTLHYEHGSSTLFADGFESGGTENWAAPPARPRFSKSMEPTSQGQGSVSS